MSTSSEPSGTATSSSSTTGDGGRGRRSNGGRGRGRHNHHGRGSSNGNRSTSGTSFTGDSTEMNGHVHQCFGEGNGGQTQFAKTTEVLGQYITKNIKFPGDMTCLTRELKEPKLVKPANVAADADEFDKLEWKENAEDYIKRVRQLKHSTKTIYSVIWGQCSEALRARLRSTPDFVEKYNAEDCAWILNSIKGIMLRFEGQRFIFLSMADATEQIYNF